LDRRRGQTLGTYIHKDYTGDRTEDQDGNNPGVISMLKCYDSVTDGSVSRWSFHTACVDPTVPLDAPCRKNVVVRSFVFF
jgi:hypothetical protein